LGCRRKEAPDVARPSAFKKQKIRQNIYGRKTTTLDAARKGAKQKIRQNIDLAAKGSSAPDAFNKKAKRKVNYYQASSLVSPSKFKSLPLQKVEIEN
jgi:hypothetical protein